MKSASPTCQSAAGHRCRSAVAYLLALALLLPHHSAVAGIRDLLDADARFSIFASALKQTDLWKQLDNQEPVTLFVPSDQTLRAEGSAFLLEKVLVTETNRQRLHDLMSYHVHIGARLTRDDVRDIQLVTAGGACFPVYHVGTGIRVGPEAVVIDHVLAEQGSLFVIDRLLWRPWMGEDHCHDSWRAITEREYGVLGDRERDRRHRRSDLLRGSD